MRKILALTSIRSEYDLMSRVYQRLHSDSQVEFRLLVSGAHLSPSFGFTIQDIKKDGLPILAEVETLISADSSSARLKTASILLGASIDIIKAYEPDLIIFAGDREDVLVGAMLGSFLGIPTAHFFGGDHAADGHVDNPVRHATSKLASTHFVSISEHRERLLRLGESANRIFVIGSVALDKFVVEPALPLAHVLGAMAAKPHAYQAPLALLIFHPIDSEKHVSHEYLTNATQALVEKGFHVCLGSPNTDPGNFKLNQLLDQLALHDQVTCYRNLSRPQFINLFQHVALIAGNSSAGILEAATLKIPAINIGERQRGRLCGENVLFSGGELSNIRAALEIALSPTFTEMLRTLRNPYGDGHSADAAVDLLKTLPFDEFLRKPEDPLHADH
ncbi:UDP-N-acetylglucosamine 2-epimerase [Undibacterium sp. Jales W-56]|uniref:UDP-N-acetylglucosamine 2-epimerase n=1 Tax=Undibacterium sp. Jales W-56 TaxID=2897325 RepID=UPI0021D28E33|nr:UDP-N-acetylglucosamine 2-epimerase [Undibacterium sp. Jales W-56]MCU6433893.1 UDP-N-acetylglucosamine 2-epimerase [Undibacterium sp. Jales W-56]